MRHIFRVGTSAVVTGVTFAPWRVGGLRMTWENIQTRSATPIASAMRKNLDGAARCFGFGRRVVPRPMLRDRNTSPS